MCMRSGHQRNNVVGSLHGGVLHLTPCKIARYFIAMSQAKQCVVPFSTIYTPNKRIPTMPVRDSHDSTQERHARTTRFQMLSLVANI